LLAGIVALGNLGYRITVASRRMPTICSSENLPFFMALSLPVEATFSSFSWSEKGRAGQRQIAKRMWNDDYQPQKITNKASDSIINWVAIG